MKIKIPSKIIFLSTISVYGENMNQKIYSEDDQANPVSPYAITKLKNRRIYIEHKLFFSSLYTSIRSCLLYEIF